MYGHAPPPYAPAVPPGKKKMSGCLLAALIVGGLGVIGVIVAGIVVVKVWNIFTPQERAQLEAEIRESAVAAGRPGADALRADGCFGVDVVEVATMPALTRSLVDAGPQDGLTERIIVDCRPDIRVSTMPTCERLAKTYVTAVGTAPGPFRVMVHKAAGQPPLCSELRAPNGAPLP